MHRGIKIYEKICVLSANMVAAARAHDWDLLIALEKEVMQLRHGLGDESEIAATRVTGRKADLIQQILDDDAQIRQYTEPWMDRLRPFLSDNFAARRGQFSQWVAVSNSTLDTARYKETVFQPSTVVSTNQLQRPAKVEVKQKKLRSRNEENGDDGVKEVKIRRKRAKLALPNAVRVPVFSSRPKLSGSGAEQSPNKRS